ncbi:MAG TPA: hypothetical protein VGX23_30405 [Actinocrinis sp.]|nr:hypothetical protein [Actinocrinis sp.]
MATTTTGRPVIVGIDDSSHAMRAAMWAAKEAATSAQSCGSPHRRAQSPPPGSSRLEQAVVSW